jgi:hypothetical protein
MFPTYPTIYYLTNGAGHQYNGLTAEVKRRGAGGLEYQFSYTLARDIGDAERGQTIENAYDRERDKGVCFDIPTHKISVNVDWPIPVGKGKRYLSGASRVLDAIVGNWAFSAIYTFRSGHHLTPTWTGPDPTGTRYTSSTTTPATTTIRPNALCNGNLPSDQRMVHAWFNAFCFTASSPGSFGTSAPGVIIGPGLSSFDTGLFKAFRIRERATVRWELTAINTFNHPNSYGQRTHRMS